MSMAQIIIPAGTVCEIAGVKLRFGEDVKADGTPEEVAELYVRLYPPSAPGVLAVDGTERG